MRSASGASEGDLLLIVADPRIDLVHKVLGGLRNHLAERFGLIPELDPTTPEAWRFVWITDFPWFEWNEDAGRWDFIHHPFTGVVEETMKYLDDDPGKVISKAYDITLNGWELASGSIRIHDRATQQKMFGALGITPEEAEREVLLLVARLPFRCPAPRRDRSRDRPGGGARGR